MKKRINHKIVELLLFAGICVAPAGCTPDTSTTLLGTGRLSPSVTVSADIIVGSGQKETALLTPPAASEMSLSVTDLGSGNAHTWTPWTTFDPDGGLSASSYRVEAFYGDSLAEGFDCPFYMAQKQVNVQAGQTTEVSLDCKLANAMIRLEFTQTLIEAMTKVSATLHSGGGSFVDYPADETRPVFIRPGRLALILNLQLPDGRSADFVAATIEDVRSGHYYNIKVDCDRSAATPVIVVTPDSQQPENVVKTPLTDDFINAAAPFLIAEGFTSGSLISIKEGTEPSGQISVSTDAANLQRLMLDLSSTAQGVAAAEGGTDLFNLSPERKAELAQCGIVITQSASILTVDFTQMTSKLRLAGSTGETVVSLMAVNNLGKVSEPVGFTVSLEAVDVRLEAVGYAVIGVDKSMLRVASTVPFDENFTIELVNEQVKWEQVTPVSVTDNGDGTYDVTIDVYPGERDVTGRILYCGRQREMFTIRRSMPSYTVSVEPFALKAYVTVSAADPDMLATITSMLNVFSGSDPLAVIERDTDAGIVTIGGLQAETRYTLTTSLFDSPSDGQTTAPVEIVTEKARQLPNPSFDEVKDAIKYASLPSGGRYSQSVVSIFNLQNRTSYNLQAPKGWANTNAKTFCTDASNHNTWYMQPSVFTDAENYNGGYSVKIQSTAWDTSGAPIADYLQQSQPFLKYNPNVPEIRFRAAGRLFLGEYTFNAATTNETFTEGYDFTSRPSALNGFYKYLPCQWQPSDCGYVEVSLIGLKNGSEVEIARGTGQLVSSFSFRAFSVPLSYSDIHTPAAKIKVTFASTDNIGTIQQESAEIITYPNPLTATSLGSALWIDEISLSY